MVRSVAVSGLATYGQRPLTKEELAGANDRARLYKEAKSYMSLRSKRKKYVADYKAGRLESTVVQERV